MNRRRLPLLRKYRQYRFLAKRLRKWMESGAFAGFSANKQQALQRRLQRLYEGLRRAYAPVHLRNLLASGVFLLSMNLYGQAQPAFTAAQANPFGLAPLNDNLCPAAVDIDNDGDLDLFTGQYYSGSSIVFFENTGTPTAASFAAPQANPFGLVANPNSTMPGFADIDGDGDQDAFLGAYYGEFIYFENTGTPTAPAFAAPQTNPFGLTGVTYTADPNLADLDNDGDLDMLAGSGYGDFFYFENTGTATAPAFGAAQTNPFGLTPFPGLYLNMGLVDADQDGDLDIFGGGYYTYGDIYFWENTGTPSAPAFAASQVNPFGLTATTEYSLATAADLDGDGDADLIVASFGAQLIFFEDTSGVQNAAPMLTLSGDTTFCVQGTLLYAFTAMDADGDPLTVTATSTDQGILPDGNLSVMDMAPSYILEAIPLTGQLGTVDVILSASDGTATTSDTLTVTIEDCNTAPMFEGSIPATMVCLADPLTPVEFRVNDAEGDALSFTITSDNQSAATDGQFSVSGMLPNFTLGATAFVGDTGSAVITIIASDGSQSDTLSFDLMVDLCTGIGLPSLEDLAVYPNPAHEQIEVLLPTAMPINHIRLLDLRGKAIRQWTGNQHRARQTLSLNGIPAGVYMLEVATPQGSATHKIIKE